MVMVEKYSQEITEKVMPIMQQQMMQQQQMQQQMMQQQQMQQQQIRNQPPPPPELTSAQKTEQYNQHMRESAVTHLTVQPEHDDSASINGKYESAGPMGHFHG